LASLGNLLGELVNVVKLGNEIGEGGVGSFLGDDVDDLLSDDLDLLVLGITGLSGLVLLSAGESSNENSQNITILGLSFAVSVDQSLPFSDELAESVSGHVHSVEVGHAGSSLDIFDGELDLSPAVLVVTQFSIRGFDNSSLQVVGGDSCAGGSGDAGLSDNSVSEGSRGLDVVPFLSKERVLDLFLGTLLFA